MAEGSVSLESTPGEDQTDLGVIKSLESQVENLKDEMEKLKKKTNEEKERQNKVNEELNERLRDQYRKEKDGIEKGHKEAILKVKADLDRKLNTAREEKQEVEKLLTKERMAKESLLLEYQKESTKKSEDFDALKNDMETKLRQEITDLRRIIASEEEERNRESEASKHEFVALRAQLVESESKSVVAKEEKESLEEELQTLKARLETVLKNQTRLEQVIQTKEIEIEGLKIELSEREKASAEGIGQEMRKEWEELREKARKSEADLKYWKETAQDLEQKCLMWKATIPRIEEDVKRVQEENDCLKNEHENRIEGLVKEHKEEMAAVHAEHEQSLHVLQQEADDIVATVKDELLGDLKNEKESSFEDKEKLVAEHVTAIEELRAHYEALLVEKDKQQAQFEQISADRLDEREKRLNADSKKTIAAREEKIATLEREIKEKNEQLLTMRDKLNQEYIQSAELARREHNEQRVSLAEEYERSRNDIKQNNEIVSKNLEDRIAELKAELSGCRDEIKSEVARLTKEKEDALAAAREELQDQCNEFEGRIKQLVDNHSSAMELARQNHVTLLENLKEEASQTKADELGKMACDYEKKLDSVSEERENLKSALGEKHRQSQREIENLMGSHEEVMREEGEKQKNFTKLLKAQAKESSDDMIRFLIGSHSTEKRDLVNELGKSREDVKTALETKDRECKEQLAVLREEFREETLQAEKRRTQELNCKALEWGKREGELVQLIESLKALVAKLEQKHATEESEEIKRLELVSGGLESEMEKMKKEHVTDVGELRAKFWEEKRNYESVAQAERVENDKKHMNALCSLVEEVNKSQGKLDQKEQLAETLRAEVRQLENSSKDSGALKKELEGKIEQLEGKIEQLRLDVAAKAEEFKAVGEERDRVQTEIKEKQLEVTKLLGLVSGLREEKETERNRADSALAELQDVNSGLKLDKYVQTEIESSSQNGAGSTSKTKKTVVKRLSKFFHRKRKPQVKRVSSTCISRRVSRRASVSNEKLGEDNAWMNGGPGIEVRDTASLLNEAAGGKSVAS
ncbi:golgin subfamily A member 4-like [Lineus longissimus]|uniref:golgin subfamily A member 4-like n=1 Tax=Lineus longissimus TaxID=88925 RepID=UPI00315DC1B4